MHEGRVKPLDTRRARGGQAGLRPRDHRAAAIPARPSRPSWTPRPPRKAGALGLEGREMGAGRRVPRLDRPARILGRPAVHPGRLLPAPPPDPGRHDRVAAQGDRRQGQHALRAEKDRLRAMAVDPEITATALIAFVRDSKLPGRGPADDRRAGGQAERGAQVAHAPRAAGSVDPPCRRRRPEGRRPVPDLGLRGQRQEAAVRPASASRPSGRPRSSAAASTSPSGSRPTRPTAATGSPRPA